MPFKNPKDMKKYMSDKTMLTVNKSTRDRLQLLGHKGESWDDVLNKLADAYEKVKE